MKAFFIHIKIPVLIIIAFHLSAPSFAAGPTDTLLPKKRYLVSALPVVFYTPETRFGFGATGIYLFNFKSDSIFAQKSSINLGLAYTQNKQVLFYLPYNLFIRNRAYQLYGELGYNKFFYNFYGTGNNQRSDFVERYGVEFPRLRISAVKRVAKNFYSGFRYAYDKFSLFQLDTAGQLIRGDIPGSRGGTVSGFGLVTIYDSRDNVFYPERGWWGELVIYRDSPLTGSSFNYTRIALDVCRYFHYQKNILALNAYSIYSDSDLPFFQMGVLGGQKKMRGFYEGRYRDNNVLVFQAEYRRHLFWLLGATVFADIGQVAHRYDGFNYANWRYTYGAGLRLMLDKAQKINLRVDIGVGNKQILTYFTVGEAF